MTEKAEKNRFVAADKKIVVPADKKRVPVGWFELEDHPMSDAEFLLAYAIHIFRTDKEATMREMRNRLVNYVNNALHEKYAAELAEYRKAYPLES